MLTNQSKRRGKLLRPDRNIKNGRSQRGRYVKANSTPNHSSFVGPFFTLQHYNINTSSKTAPNYRLHRKTRWMKRFWRFALASLDFHEYGTAHDELLCVCSQCAMGIGLSEWQAQFSRRLHPCWRERQRQRQREKKEISYFVGILSRVNHKGLHHA